jgi:hypothetical protein
MRLVHYIVDLRLHHPSTPIIGGKSDFKAAYRRIMLHGDVAEKCAIMLDEFSLPSLRLTFGGSPCPNHVCLFSELTVDLANDLLHCPSWNPTNLASPHATKIQEPLILEATEDFTPARELDISIAPDDAGKVDIFIDDGLAVTIDINNNRNRAIQSLLLAIHTLCCLIDANEPISHEDCLSLSKLEEDCQMSEKFTILGWDLNKRALTVALPSKKFKRWNTDLKEIIS